MAKDRLSQYAALRQALLINKQRYGNDPRYRLDRVTDGFAERAEPATDDTALLERICAAYNKAVDKQQSASAVFMPTHWWRLVSSGSLGPAIHALKNRDIKVLQSMYRNFFRDPCSAGLVGLPVNMSRSYFGLRIKTNYKHLLLGDALHQFDLWKERTGGRFTVHSLKSPRIGNPFGIIIDGILVGIGAEYQHFYAQKIASLLPPSQQRCVVSEIGGGYGGMAYYLIRDNPQCIYINFDLPETIALASYYLLKSFPSLRATLYGEAELNAQTIAGSDMILMPNFEISRLPAESIDVSFNSHLLADMEQSAIHTYLDEIMRTTRGHFLHLNRSQACETVSAYLSKKSRKLIFIESETARWHNARSHQNDEIEQLYSVR